MKLGDLEKKVMNTIWNDLGGQSFSVRDIMDLLNYTAPKQYAYNTILTVITHLYQKDLLRREKSGKTFTYNAKLSRELFVAKASRAVFDQMRRDYGNLAIAHFAHIVEDIDPALLAEAQKEIDNAQQ
ncbi:MAG: BlaI/MecI/CopY family transcriptional regulator [Candidatus Kerfeldbacteria bacterium]|nr:BlaI/MecI/CopY family transcriptional regulator [Candidatus Kerfeldbacteria bacterium]